MKKKGGGGGGGSGAAAAPEMEKVMGVKQNQKKERKNAIYYLSYAHTLLQLLRRLTRAKPQRVLPLSFAGKQARVCVNQARAGFFRGRGVWRNKSWLIRALRVLTGHTVEGSLQRGTIIHQ